MVQSPWFVESRFYCQHMSVDDRSQQGKVTEGSRYRLWASKGGKGVVVEWLGAAGEGRLPLAKRGGGV